VIDIRHESVNVENDHFGAWIAACNEHLKEDLVGLDGVHRSGIFLHFLAHSCGVARFRESQ
jgi:hypothetical protein